MSRSKVGNVGIGTLWEINSWIAIFGILVIPFDICRYKKTVKDFINFHIGVFLGDDSFFNIFIHLMSFPFEDDDDDSFICESSFIFGADSEGNRSFFQKMLILDFDGVILKYDTLRQIMNLILNISIGSIARELIGIIDCE